ncbi:TetR family transcriptional regulator [Microbacterium sp. YMB-B2]|uniref:TetR family transcriptional regulator n=1 Tax=Microbacterium tenebrionis TaxID=2830665 RepID=A0A9X1LMM8_9MICO|nr:TetR family transcriptional regulator [Microbacterium tenebrionis]MCC2028549.1 TetR family transcriptional regulator [Microbacterium tenebrionis]
MSAAPASARNDKTDVVAAAMRVLADSGLPGLSMRRIADEIDVQVSALYWHFPNKQALLAAVSAQIVGAGSAPPEVDAIAQALRDRLLAHRDGAEIVSSSLALGLLELPARAALVSAARDMGLDAAAADVAADTIVHYVIGYTFHEQQRLHAAVVGAADASVDLVPEGLDDRAGDFDAGLAMIIAGVRATASVSGR